MNEAIKISGLCKTYKGNTDRAVDNLSLSICEGEIFGLLGPNGAGKSTTIGILCGLKTFDAGEATICGYSLKTDLRRIKPLIGAVPQDIALYPTLTAYENLKIFGGIYGITGKALRSTVNELLERFGLEHSKNRRIDKYSGGMKRRINLIAGILHAPKIIFLDEPTVGIDIQSKTVILDNLNEINKTGTTIIYTSHYMEEAERICNRIAFIDEGKKAGEGIPSEMIAANPDCDSLESLYLKITGKNPRDL